jgi:alcohol dehydrogenase class IV
VVEEARRHLEPARADAVVAVGGGSAIVTRREADGRLTSPRLAAPKVGVRVLQLKAGMPVMARPMIRMCTSSVPS